MSKRITISITEELASRARKEAEQDNTSVSKLVARVLEDEMHRRDEYWAAYEMWKEIKPITGLDASKRLSRDEVHERPPCRT